VEINNIVDTLGTSAPLFTARSGIVVLPNSEIISSGISNSFIGLLFLSILLILFIFNRPIYLAIGNMYRSAFYERDLESMRQMIWMNIIKVFAFIVSSVIMSIVIYKLDLMPTYFSKGDDPMLDFFGLIGIFCVYFLLKYIVVFFINKVSNESYFKGTISYSILFLLLVALISLVLVIVSHVFWPQNLNIMRWFTGIFIGLMTLSYFFFFLRILLSRHVSIFYSILYLCTMDILPIGIFLSLLLCVK